MQLIHIKIDKTMKQDIELLCKDYSFANTTEFIRDSIRKNIEAHKTKYALQLLRKNFKSFEGTHITKAEKAAAFKELAKLKGWRINDSDIG